MANKSGRWPSYPEKKLAALVEGAVRKVVKAEIGPVGFGLALRLDRLERTLRLGIERSGEEGEEKAS